ncbi:MAG: hypothetical protein Q7U89_06430 [Coriobacteriia bacterium]|nr:hypothetical protein [Coriobacteriia bacterium]
MHFALQPADTSKRARATRQLFSIAFEHGDSVRILIEASNYTSAFGLVRLQYEALVRGFWLSLVASEDEVAHIGRDLSVDGVERLPMTLEMLKLLRGNAPGGVMVALEDFREKSLKPLNSFVHSGGHAYQRAGGGYPEALVSQVLVASNGLQWVCALEVAALADDANAAVRLHGIRTTFADCLPASAV